MTALTYKVFWAMCEYDRGDARRIQHFTKVHEYASLIGKAENLDDETQELLEITAIVHDIGIKLSMEKYGNCAGPNQEKEGAVESLKLLRECGVSEETAERVSFIVGHHHTYTGIDGIDWQIILEADYLVNAYESNHSKETIRNSKESFFRTESGKKLLDIMFDL
ncbi:MAG: HD domain-containing protein [Clostridia bacterium]|nr:HD domain-containing protein [Clostridia bacterium]